MSSLPFHHRTHLQALAIGKRGPIWPVMGGSDDATPEQVALANGQQDGQQEKPENSDKGFPDNTPVAQMNADQKAAYYRFQNRQTDNKLAAFKGVTPQQVADMQSRLEQLENEKLTADEKAVKEAAEKAARDAKSSADAEWQPRYQALQLKAAASQVITGDKLDAFLAITDPSKFANEQGEIDESKVMGHLTAIFGQKEQQAPAYQWGQHGGTQHSAGPGAAGRAEAERRASKRQPT